MEARHKELVLEGVTPITLDDDVSEVGDNDLEWECAECKVVDHHAVDWKTAKANSKIITGNRSVDGEAAKMWMWGQRQALLFDGFHGSTPWTCT